MAIDDITIATIVKIAPPKMDGGVAFLQRDEIALIIEIPHPHHLRRLFFIKMEKIGLWQNTSMHHAHSPYPDKEGKRL